MSLKSLEEKAVEIEIDKNLIKVVSIECSVESVSGYNKPIEINIMSDTIYQKKLHITLDPKTSTEDIGLLKFQGTSPVRGGDNIKAGLILDKYSEKYEGGNILYLGILKQDGSFGRIDYMDGYNPMHGDASKLGLP
jgi:hypothetical protein